MTAQLDDTSTGTERYEAFTRGIRVFAQPFYLEDQSQPENDRYVWAYAIEIQNEGASTVQLTERTWIITDGRGEIEHVHGAGVVGEQPILNPGDSFQYTSGCPLNTNSGFMVGRYTMRDEGGEHFEVDIPAFALDLPHSVRTMN